MKYKQTGLDTITEFMVISAKTTFHVKPFHIVRKSHIALVLHSKIAKEKREEDRPFLDSTRAYTNELEF
jgi:hypothetical protein